MPAWLSPTRPQTCHPEPGRPPLANRGERSAFLAYGCELFENDGEEPRLSVSAGVASYPNDGDAIGSLLYAADKALYSAKNLRSRLVAQE